MPSLKLFLAAAEREQERRRQCGAEKVPNAMENFCVAWARSNGNVSFSLYFYYVFFLAAIKLIASVR